MKATGWVSIPDGALIAAESDPGFFTACKTLIQLIEQSRRETNEIPGMVITGLADVWLARLGYFDASQILRLGGGRRGESGALRSKLLARFKLNWLCFGCL